MLVAPHVKRPMIERADLVTRRAFIGRVAIDDRPGRDGQVEVGSAVELDASKERGLLV